MSKSAHQAARSQATIDALRCLPHISSLTYLGLKTVTATRLLAVCAQTDRDPLLELIQRFSCVTTAKAVIAFSVCASSFWPENIMVMRPCCAVISPDEQALAQIIDAAGHGDRDRLEHIVTGLVRADRREAMFGRAVELAALIQ